MQVTPLRVIAIAGLGLLSLGLAGLARADDDPLRATIEVPVGYGLGLVLPLAALWLATSSVGDLVDDRLLVYVWLKPVPRWQLPGAAILATVTIVLPLVAVPLVAAVAVAGQAGLAPSIVLAAALASLAYAGLFVAAGLWLRRALWWGLIYVLVWENGIARAADGAARLSVSSYAHSIVARLADVHVPLGGRSLTASIVVPLVVSIAGGALAVWRYRSADVD
jgi:ABC-2 type transport system permease protein